MKKGFCILLSSALLMGTVPVYGNDVEQVTHTYRAEVGTKNFYKDDVLQTLDTEIYLKDGYVMPVSYTHLDVYKRQCGYPGQGSGRNEVGAAS